MENATKPAEQGQRRRWGAIGLATMLALAATATVLVAVAQESSSGWFLRIRQNLSVAEELWSVYPDITTDADGDPITVVWIEEYDEWPASGYLGHVYLRAATAASGGWGNKVTVFAGSSAACAYYKPAVAVTGTVAHIAYVVNKPCAGPQYSELRYKACQLTGETWTCGGGKVVTSTRVVSTYVTTVDVAVNDAGDPRIVWTQYYELPPDSNQWYGTIYYQAKENGVWGDTETVWDTGNSGNPAIAWANGYDHVVCEYQDDPGGVGVVERILYRRRGSGGWASPRVLFDYYVDITVPGYYPPGNPDVAAGGGHVYAVWDISYDDAVPPSYPETYAVVYRYSNDDGGNFYALWQVHPDNNPGHGNLAHYDPVESSLLGRLQPSIALGEDYLPGVVWHGASAETGDLPSIYFSLVLSDTGKWLTPTVLISDLNDLGIGAAGIWMAKEDDGTPFGHVAYMRKWDDYDWDVFYESGSEVIPEYATIYLPLVGRSD